MSKNKEIKSTVNSSNNLEQKLEIVKLKFVSLMFPTLIENEVVDNLKSNKYEMILADGWVAIKQINQITVHLVPLSNVKVMIKMDK